MAKLMSSQSQGYGTQVQILSDINFFFKKLIHAENDLGILIQSKNNQIKFEIIKS